MTIECSITGYPACIFNIFSALLLNWDSSVTQAKKPPCELNTICVLTTAATRVQLACKIYLSKNDGKDQKTIQSSTTPDSGYHMGK